MRLIDSTGRAVSVYPVGLLADIHHGRPPGHTARYVWRQARRRNWRAVKNTFNGYLAEPYEFPEGVKRCGSGWTRDRALRSWERQLRKGRTDG